jgi:hypothetical protein
VRDSFAVGKLDKAGAVDADAHAGMRRSAGTGASARKPFAPNANSSSASENNGASPAAGPTVEEILRHHSSAATVAESGQLPVSMASAVFA